MTLIDEQGRVLGRWNALDVLVGMVLLLLIPMLYAGYLLFRPTPSALTSVEPSRIAAGTAADITVTGTNLRPYMRVSFNEHQGGGFLFADSTKAVVGASGLPAGVYDVILYDQAQERARLPRGLEVVAPPSRGTQLDLIGSFTGVTEPQLKQLTAGLKLSGVGTLLSVGKPAPSASRIMIATGLLIDVTSTNAFNLAAVIRADCELVQRSGALSCVVLGTPLFDDVVLKTLQPAAGELLFQIDQVRTPVETVPALLRVRLGGDRSALERMRVGDRDLRRQNEFAAAGSVTTLDGIRNATPSISIAMVPPPPAVGTPHVLADLAFRDVSLDIPAQRVGDEWHYAGRRLTVGGPMAFHGPGYELRGTVLSISPRPQGKR